MADTFTPPLDPVTSTSLRSRLATLCMFDGRIGRGRFWALSALYLAAFVVGMAAFMLAGILLDAKPSDVLMPVFVLVGLVFFAAMALANISIAVRRLHDRGKSGYWLMMFYILPSITSGGASLHGDGIIYLLLTASLMVGGVIELGIRRGDVGSNLFGPDPLAK